jgi:parvulin-like peptidyl-prolyl isomerase
MKLSRRTNTIILWLISIGLVLGMIITFTPTLGGFGRPADASAPALRVNGAPISELAVARARSNPLFNLVTEGEVGRDLEHLLVDELVRQELVRQEAARQRVTDAEVRQAVEEFRQARGVMGRRNDAQYLQILASAGFTDESFRVYLREQIRQEKWEASLLDGVSVSDEEVRAFYESNRDQYVTEERILARHLVFATREDAEVARLELVGGADPIEIARERSIERADRGGALGAAAGETEPRPVGRPALPTAVANVAFSLRDGGITEVVEAASAFHIVVVESYLAPAPRPFDEVAERVREEALSVKRSGVIDEEIARLRRQATIEILPTSPLRYDNVAVAQVGDVVITRSDLVRATYTNPQIQQALSPDMAFIITAFFKPAVLDQLIDQELAYQGAADLGVPFVGPRRFVAQTVLNYVARDVEVSEEQIRAYYETNTGQFTVPPTADVVQVTFADVDAAREFRNEVLAGDDPVAAAERAGGEYETIGRVGRGQLEPQLDTVLFETDGFDPLPDSNLEVSDVLVLMVQPDALPEALDETTTEGEPADAEEVAREVQVVAVLIAERTAERIRPLSEVRAQIETTLLAQERAERRAEYLAEVRERVEVVDFAGTPSPFQTAPFVVPAEEQEAPSEAPDGEPETEGAEGDETPAATPAGD